MVFAILQGTRCNFSPPPTWPFHAGLPSRCVYDDHAFKLFSECTNTESLNGGHPEMRKSKMCLMEKFKFTLAIDNTLEYDYVTEKLFDPLRAPTLPVYLGAPNTKVEYSPAAEGLEAFVD